MAGEALFLGWGQVVRGREQLALEVFQESVAYYVKLQEDGKIDRFDAYCWSRTAAISLGSSCCMASDPPSTRSGPARNFSA
jgi:hypothetical protein